MRKCENEITLLYKKQNYNVLKTNKKAPRKSESFKKNKFQISSFYAIFNPYRKAFSQPQLSAAFRVF